MDDRAPLSSQYWVTVKPKFGSQRSMKGNALSLALIMITGSLAGCLASDSDGVPEISLTDEDITGLFDDYFMDFVNNSSVTVVNEIHYHNNTTVIEGDDSSTSSVVYYSNGTGSSDYPYYILDVTFDADSVQEGPFGAPDYSLVNFNATWNYYDISAGGYRQGTFSVSCGNYYLLVNNYVVNESHAGIDYNGDGDFDDAGVDNNGDGDYNDSGVDANYDGDYDDPGVDANGDGDYDDLGDTPPDVAPDIPPDVAPGFHYVDSPNNRTYWENNDYYYDAWMTIHNQTIINILESYAQESHVQQTCGAWQWYHNNQDWTVVYEHSITVPEGFVLSCTGGVNAGGVYQIAFFYRSDSWVDAHGTTSPNASTWFEWGRGDGPNWVLNTYDGNYRWQHGIDADMSVDQFPHHCGRFAGNGEESEFKLTVTFDSALEVRVLFYYQLIPIQAVLQTE